MQKLTKQELNNKKEKALDVSLPMEERKQAHKDSMEHLMNPDVNFDPLTFDNKKGVQGYDVMKRPREAPPRRLPTLGMKPKKILEGQLVGMYESKQDLYLLIAELYNRVSDLEDIINNP